MASLYDCACMSHRRGIISGMIHAIPAPPGPEERGTQRDYSHQFRSLGAEQGATDRNIAPDIRGDTEIPRASLSPFLDQHEEIF